MFGEDKRKFQLNNKCWIYNKLFTAEDNKVRNLDHLRRSFTSSKKQ